MQTDNWNSLFPYFIKLDRSLTITEVGKSMHKLCPDLPGSLFYEKLLLKRPSAPEISFDKFCSFQDHLLLVYFLDSPVVLRGQVVLADIDTLILCVSPWITHYDQLESLNLKINDFALHNPMLDMLQLLSIHTLSIEDLKKQTMELEKAKKEVEIALKAKRDFLSVMTHELRTPLNAVIGMTNILTEESPDPSQVESLSTLKFSAESLLLLINEILDFSKLEAGKVELDFQALNLPELLHNIHQTFLVHAKEKQIDLILDVPNDLPAWIMGDSTRLTQVLFNLISNAIKFTPRGGVSIRIELVEKTDSWVKTTFHIIDSGVGIPEDKQHAIFQDFIQVQTSSNRQFGGTGLGLSITQKILKLFGSDISLKSTLGKGSTFSFVLKSKIATPISSTPTISTEKLNASLEGLRVLLAEDNEINIKITTRYLRKWGIDFEVAKNGQEAVSHCLEGEFDLILMDLLMPEMDGYEASRAIRQLSGKKMSEVPIVALSASLFDDVKEKINQAGITGFLEKPFRPAELHDLLTSYLNKEEISV